MRLTLTYFIIILFPALLPDIAFSQMQKIYLHPKSAANVKQSTFVDSIRFIPLEVRDEIKLAPYTNVQVTEKYFLLVDHSSKLVLLYAKDGHFVRKISYKKLGDSFYPSYQEDSNELVFFGQNKNYSLTPKDMIRIRLDANNPRNRKYFKKYRIDLNSAKFALERVSPDGNDIVKAYPLYDKYFWQSRINTSPLYQHPEDFELKIYEGKKLIKKFFPYNHINEPRFLYTETSAAVMKTDSPFINFVSRPYCDTIYKMIRDSLTPGYQVVMPVENSVPSSFFTTPFKNKTERENFERNNGWTFRQLYNFHETPDWLYFLVSYNSNYEAYFYQKKGETTYKAKNIKTDSSQYNLQLLNEFNFVRKDNKYYKVQKAGDLLEFFDKHKTVPVPKELEEFLKLHPQAASPVVVEFTLKTTL